MQSPDPPASSWLVRIGRGPTQNNINDINGASTVPTFEAVYRTRTVVLKKLSQFVFTTKGMASTYDV